MQTAEYKDPEILEELYVDKLMTQKEIGQKYGVSGVIIGIYLKKYGLIMMKYEKLDRIERELSKNIIQDFLNGIGTPTLVKKYKKGNKFIERILHKNHIITNFEWNQNGFDECIFSDIDAPEKAYWLGFLAADGNITEKNSKTNRFQLQIGLRDLNHLLNFADFAGFSYSDVRIRKGSPNNFCAIGSYSQKLCDDLMQIGITPRKTKIVSMPDIDDKLKRYWIAGYYDGDGSVSINAYKSLKLSLASSSKHVVEDIRDYQLNNIEIRDLKIGRKNINSSNHMYFLDWYSNNAYNIMQHIYDGIEGFAMKRKYSIAEEWKRYKDANT